MHWTDVIMRVNKSSKRKPPPPSVDTSSNASRDLDEEQMMMRCDENNFMIRTESPGKPEEASKQIKPSMPIPCPNAQLILEEKEAETHLVEMYNQSTWAMYHR